jgi:cbb3-type cytochrome oxidase subunit 1
MSWIIRHIHRVMMVSGLLTFTMVYAAIAPEAALRSSFGASLEGPVADVVVRNWGALIALNGAMLIYVALNCRCLLGHRFCRLSVLDTRIDRNKSRRYARASLKQRPIELS